MKSILIPTDFTSKSAVALKTAIELAQFSDAELTVLHTVPTPVIAGNMVSELVGENADNANQDVQQHGGKLYFSYENEELSTWLIQQLTELGYSHLYDSILQLAMVADVPNGIARTARRLGCDLIVIGTGKDARMEQVTASLTGLVDCYMLSIPEDWDWGNVKRITIASDFKEDERDSLNPILNLARVYKATIHLIHLREENSFDRQQLVHFNNLLDVLHEEEGFLYKQLETKDYEKAIFQTVMTERVDLLVMRCRNCEKPDGLIDRLAGKLVVPMFILPKRA